LYDALKEALPYEPTPVYDRHDRRAARERREIGLHAVRGGSIVGDHTVLFANEGEVIELSHRALSREVFATGALRAAVFLASRTEPGVYGMDELLASV
jgi:4-hydroxy-tetrahydrodipicolinate reductase